MRCLLNVGYNVTQKRDASLSSRIALPISISHPAFIESNHRNMQDALMDAWTYHIVCDFYHITRHTIPSTTTNILSFSLIDFESSSLKPLVVTIGIGDLIPSKDMLLLIIDAESKQYAINMFARMANMNFVQE